MASCTPLAITPLSFSGPHFDRSGRSTRELLVFRRATVLHICVTFKARSEPGAYQAGRVCALLETDTKPPTECRACSWARRRHPEGITLIRHGDMLTVCPDPSLGGGRSWKAAGKANPKPGTGYGHGCVRVLEVGLPKRGGAEAQCVPGVLERVPLGADVPSARGKLN